MANRCRGLRLDRGPSRSLLRLDNHVSAARFFGTFDELRSAGQYDPGVAGSHCVDVDNRRCCNNSIPALCLGLIERGINRSKNIFNCVAVLGKACDSHGQRYGLGTAPGRLYPSAFECSVNLLGLGQSRFARSFGKDNQELLTTEAARNIARSRCSIKRKT